MTELLRDATGALVPLGRITNELTVDFLDPALVLPTWCSVQGTGATGAAVSPATSTAPGYKITTAATSLAFGGIGTTFGLRADIFEGIMLEADGLTLDSTDITKLQPRLEIASAANGVRVVGRGMGASPYVEATLASKRYDWLASGMRPHNMGLLWLPKRNVAYWLIDRQPVGRLSGGMATYASSQPVVAKVQVRTNEAVAHSFTLSRLRLTTWRNQ